MNRYTLTSEDRELCDQFGELLKRIVGGGLSSLSVCKIASVRNFTCSAQDGFRAFSNDFSPQTLSLQDCVLSALDQFYIGNPSEEERKALRIAELRADLARLEGDPA